MYRSAISIILYKQETDNIYSHKYIIIRYHIRGVSIKTIFSNMTTK